MRSTSRIGRWSGVLLAAIAMSIFAVGQTDASKSGGALDHVLTQMDTEATFAWDQYQKVINETETQKGKIYFRRQGKEIQMFADVMEPDAKSVLFTGGKIQLYQPKIDQVTEYTTGKNRTLKATSSLVSAAAATTCSSHTM